jgi:hypothetical protein
MDKQSPDRTQSNAIDLACTAPQSDLVNATLSAEQIVELARLKDFL